MFLMAIPSHDCKLPEITSIEYGLMKLQSASIYSKAIAKWKPGGKSMWYDFKNHFKEHYARMLQEGTGNTMSAKGYEAAFQAINDDASTIASIIKGFRPVPRIKLTTTISSCTILQYAKGAPKPLILFLMRIRCRS